MKVFPKLGPWPCTWTLPLHSLPLPQQAFSLDVWAYRCDRLTSDLHRTRFLTQTASNFKSTVLLLLYRRDSLFLLKDVSGCRQHQQGLSHRGRDSVRQLYEHSKRPEGKYGEKMNLFNTKHVYFNFSGASEKSLNKTPEYKSKWGRERKRASKRKSLLWLAMKDYSESITVFT